MTAITAQLQEWQGRRQSNQLTVFGAYEDSMAARRVRELCDELPKHVFQEGRITRHFWLFNELLTPKLRAIAASEAARADLIVLAARWHEELPDEVKSWIGEWLGRKDGHPTALVALLEPPASEAADNPVQAYLEEVAKSGKMEFFVRTSERSGDHWLRAAVVLVGCSPWFWAL